MRAGQTTEWTARFTRGCAGMFGCGDVTCRLCTVVAHLPQVRTMDAIHERDTKNTARDGDAKLSAAKERRHPMWQKRHRDGPHRGNA